MAKIRSSLEIALERAAAMGGGADLATQEAHAKGKALARKFLGGDLEASSLALEVRGLGDQAAGPARGEAVKVLGRALLDGADRALAGLGVLVQGAGAAARQAHEQVVAAQLALSGAEKGLGEVLAKEMSADLARAGFAGPALRPNPQAHPQKDQRRQEVLAEALTALEGALGRLQKELG